MRQWFDKLSDALPDRLNQLPDRLSQLPDRLSQALPMERRAPRRSGLGPGLGLLGVGLGAGFMYFFDPDTGAHRRAQLRARLETLARRTSEAMDGASRQMKSRVREVMPSRAASSSGEARPS